VKEIPFVARQNRRLEGELAAPLSRRDEVAWFPLMNFLGYELQARQLDSKAMPVWSKTGQPS